MDQSHGNSSFFGNGGNPRHSSGLGGINLANISYIEPANDLLHGESKTVLNEPIVSEVMVTLKDVFYINDLVVINKALAGKLVKCGLEGSSIMVRAAKEKLYESSE